MGKKEGGRERERERDREESAGVSSEEHPPRCRCPLSCSRWYTSKHLLILKLQVFIRSCVKSLLTLCACGAITAGSSMLWCRTPGQLLSFVQAHYWVSKWKAELQLQDRERGEGISHRRQPLPMRTCHNNSTGWACARPWDQQPINSGVGKIWVKYCTGGSGKRCPRSLDERVQSWEQKAAVGLQVRAPKALSSKAAPVSEGEGDVYGVAATRSGRAVCLWHPWISARNKGYSACKPLLAWASLFPFSYANIKAVTPISSAAD